MKQDSKQFTEKQSLQFISQLLIKSLYKLEHNKKQLQSSIKNVYNRRLIHILFRVQNFFFYYKMRIFFVSCVYYFYFNPFLYSLIFS